MCIMYIRRHRVDIKESVNENSIDVRATVGVRLATGVHRGV